MRIPRFFSVLLLQVILAAGVSLAAESLSLPSILPQTFAGWQISKSAETKDPATADPVKAAYAQRIWLH
jgi:hypothetical protein